MVSYDIDSPSRTHVIAIIVLLSAAIGTGLSFAIDALEIGWITAPTSLAIFTGIHWLWDNHIWRNKYVLKLHTVPDLNGKWKGKLDRGVAPGTKSGKLSDISMHITQTWSKISVVFRGSSQGKSISTMAKLSNLNPADVSLSYSYVKAPTTSTPANDSRSEGLTILEVKSNNGSFELSGHYISDQLRAGTISEVVRTP